MPTNPPPWVNATFDDGGTAGTVDLTISALGLDGNNEKIAGVYFNLDPVAFDQADLDAMLFEDLIKTGDLADPDISKIINGFKADGDGFFDILIDLDQDGWELAFNGGDAIQYTIVLDSLTANSFDFLSAPDGAGTGLYKSTAHLLSLGTTGDSAWVTTPEPATIILLVIGGLAVFIRRRA